MKRSFRSLARQPNGEKVLRIFKNLAQLCFRKPTQFINTVIDQVLEITDGALKAKPELELIPEPVVQGVAKLSKQQYVAIVGVNTIGTEVCYEVARNKGFTKNNIRVCDDVDRFKNGNYRDLLESSNCVAIIFGAIPHSHGGNIEKTYHQKAVLARTKSGNHGKLKLTKESLGTALDAVSAKIENPAHVGAQ